MQPRPISYNKWHKAGGRLSKDSRDNASAGEAEGSSETLLGMHPWRNDTKDFVYIVEILKFYGKN